MLQTSFLRSLIYSAVFLILGVTSAGQAMAAKLDQLQTFFDETTVSGTLDAQDYTNSIDFSAPDSGFLELNFSLMLENAGLARRNSFGIYDAATNTSISIFDGSATVGSQTSVIITSSNQLLFDDISFNLGGPISFFLERGNNRFHTNFSEKGSPLPLIYEGQGQELSFAGINTIFGPNNRIIAFEDRKGGDEDYNDMLVYIDVIAAVPQLPDDQISEDIPEPSLLSGLGMITLLGMARKRKG